MSAEKDVVQAILGSRPVARDGVLVVHSSFRKLSHAGLRAEAFCEALMAGMVGGTVLMPTMTWRTVTRENPVFDELRTPSHTGVLTEVFRTGFSSHRSLHPTHSVAGLGPLARLLLSTHHYGSTPCPGASPYGLMREYDAHILMLGVGMESCTAIHHAEEMIAPELYVSPMEDAENYKLIDRYDCIHNVKCRRHPHLPRNFNKFNTALRNQGALAEGIICDTPWLLFSVQDLYRVLFSALVERKEATLN